MQKQLFNPIKECFRCGYKVKQPHCVFIHTPNDDVARIGPMFEVNYKLDIPHDDIEGLPLLMCSVNCALDSLAVMFRNDHETFTVYCILLAAIYDVNIPGLPQTKKYHLEPTSINKDPKTLLRWGGIESYTKYRRDFICPPSIIEYLFDNENDDDLISKVKKPEDDDIPTDPHHDYDIDDEVNLIEVIDEGEVNEGDFDFIEPALQKYFTSSKM